jgi:hypothetical protein
MLAQKIHWYIDTVDAELLIASKFLAPSLAGLILCKFAGTPVWL